MPENNRSFQGSSEREIKRLISNRVDTEAGHAANVKKEAGTKRMVVKFGELFKTHDRKWKGRTAKWEKEREEFSRTGKEIIDSIEQYAAMTLSVDLELKLQRHDDISELEQRRHALHNKIRSLATSIGIPDTQILDLVEMRVQDRLAESEIATISRKATEAVGVPIRASDDDLVYSEAYTGRVNIGGSELQWRLPEVAERKNTYSLGYSFIYRQRDDTHYERSARDDYGKNPDMVDNLVSKERVNDTMSLFKKTAGDLKEMGVSYDMTQYHYCHDEPADDWVAFQLVTFLLKCKKGDIDKVIGQLKKNANEAGLPRA